MPSRSPALGTLAGDRRKLLGHKDLRRRGRPRRPKPLPHKDLRRRLKYVGTCAHPPTVSTFS